MKHYRYLWLSLVGCLLFNSAIGFSQGFTRLSPRGTGVQHVNGIDPTHPLNRLYASSQACGGIAIGDVNGDKLPDLFLTSGPGPNHLYIQTGQWNFTDRTPMTGLTGPKQTWSLGTTMADIDGDGDLDIYVCNYDQPNQCFLNDGEGNFTDEASRLGLDIRDASLMASFCDYDNDGDLDVYLLTYRYDLNYQGPEAAAALKGQVFPEWEKYFNRKQGRFYGTGRPDRLFKNNANNAFKDVTAEAGLSLAQENGNSATWWDFDDDGFMDLYVANDFEDPDHLYHNLGNGKFKDVTRDATPQTSWFSRGAATGDLNGDGRIDLVVADLAPRTHFASKLAMGDMQRFKEFLDHSEPRQFMRNTLFLNTGTPRLMEAGELAGIGQSDWTWAVKIQDFDNDGLQDVFMANGVSRPYGDSDLALRHAVALRTNNSWKVYENDPPQNETNRLFRNKGDLQFEDVASDWGLGVPSMSYASATGDLDNDGDLDLVVANLNEPIAIYRNNAINQGVTLRFKGVSNNRFGVGVMAQAKTAHHRMVRRLLPSQGFQSCDQHLIHFGLGNDTVLEELRITWPDQFEQVYTNLLGGRSYDVDEGGESERLRTPQKPLFKADTLLKNVRHKENTYDDFRQQPLLPYKLSRLGPGLALSDVNGDGLADLLLPGAAGMSSELHFQQEDGSFKWSFQKVFSSRRNGEALGALFFEANGDAAPDLMVAYGGYENPEGSNLLRDQLYLNDGMGRFAAAPPGHLPDIKTSSSVITAADVDRDGDLDLFIGGRMIPGKYPEHPPSRLLVNDGKGRFSDSTLEQAPGLLSSGLVTGACWSDVDNDGWLDLMVSHEWGPIKCYQNRFAQGKGLVDVTKATGLNQWTGWWNGIMPTDADGDGDMDYVVTNTGLGSKYQATTKKPAVLFYGRFDEREEQQIIEASFKEGKLVPVRGFSCTSGRIPGIAERFPTFRDFASAQLFDLYPKEQLKRAKRYTANTLASGILINDAGNFRFEPFPRIVQLAPLFGAVAGDRDNDGLSDLILVGNFYHPQRETPRMAGGLGWFLKGQGDGQYTPVWPAESGLDLSEDARALVLSDLNRDGTPDFIAGINDGAPRAFMGTGDPGIRIALMGKAGNPHSVGSQVRLSFDDGTRQTMEINAGAGYLSQSPSAAWFGRPKGAGVSEIQVRWPDGIRKRYTPGRPDAQQYKIKY